MECGSLLPLWGSGAIGGGKAVLACRRTPKASPSRFLSAFGIRNYSGRDSAPRCPRRVQRRNGSPPEKCQFSLDEVSVLLLAPSRLET